MRKLALVVILVALVLTPLIAEEKPPAPIPDLTVRIVRTDVALSIEFEPDAWRILAGEEQKSVLAEIDAAPGAETVLPWPKGAKDLPLSVSALERISYDSDFDTDASRSIKATLKVGVIADFTRAADSVEGEVTVGARITLADLTLPIPTFTTTLGGRTVTFELPEIAVRRLDKPVSLAAGQCAIFPAGRVGREAARKQVYLLVRADAEAGDGAEDSPGFFPPRLR